MFSIKKLIKLFVADDVKIMLEDYYNSTQESNKELSDALFEQLYNLKINNPDIDIKVYLEIEEK